jgi:hypothetical protein
MFDVKISAIAAGLAFIVSFLLGLLSGASFPALIIRPLVFAVLFFIIAAIVYFAVSHFLPELLDGDISASMDAGEVLSPGSRINITEEESAGMPAYAAAQPDDSEDDLGDIGDLLKQGRTARPAPRPTAEPVLMPAEPGFPGLDQSGEDGYTRNEAVSAGVRNGGGFTGSGSARPKTYDPAESTDALPDLDAMARAFLPDSGEDEADTTEYSVSDDPLKRPAAGGRGRKLEGDFNPKELAAGIRTILKKEG